MIKEAVEKLKQGEVVAFPTETFFGLGVNPFDRAAVEQLLRIKERGYGDGLSLVIDKAERVDEWCEEEEIVGRKRKILQAAFWPGPLTLVVKVKKEKQDLFAPGIYGKNHSIAVRVSPESLTRTLAESIGGAVTATSANFKGQTPSRTLEEVKKYFPNLCVVGQEKFLSSFTLSSTILDVRELPFKILREGAISEGKLKNFLA